MANEGSDVLSSAPEEALPDSEPQAADIPFGVSMAGPYGLEIRMLRDLTTGKLDAVTMLETRYAYLCREVERLENMREREIDAVQFVVNRWTSENEHESWLQETNKSWRPETLDEHSVRLAQDVDKRELAASNRESAVLQREKDIRATFDRMAEACLVSSQEAWYTPTALVYKLIKDGEVVHYIGECNGAIGRINGHGDKDYDAVLVHPAPDDKRARTAVERALIHEHEAEHGQRPKYNKGYH